jgi:Holliday junction DNA helicase RuvB
MSEDTSPSRQGLPPTLNHVIGQRLVVEQAKVALDAAFQEGTPFPHSLMTGPPGLGKTMLAQVIAAEMATPWQEVLGQSLALLSELHSFLLAATDKSVVFIDEVDELPPLLQTTLYKAVEERRIFLEPPQPGRFPQAVPLSNFTLLMASNHEHSIVQPLRDRMKLTLRFDYYSTEELAEVVQQRSRKLGWQIEDEVLSLVAQRGRGTPRIALRILESCRRVCRSIGETTITKAHFEKTCELEGIDPLGLDRHELQLLSILRVARRPVRLNVLASRLGLPGRTIQVFEEYLLRQGLLERTPEGRQITQGGVEHLERMTETK